MPTSLLLQALLGTPMTSQMTPAMQMQFQPPPSMLLDELNSTGVYRGPGQTGMMAIPNQNRDVRRSDLEQPTPRR